MMIVTLDYTVVGDYANAAGGDESMSDSSVAIKLSTLEDGTAYFRRTIRLPEPTFINALAKASDRLMIDMRNRGVTAGNWKLLEVKVEVA